MEEQFANNQLLVADLPAIDDLVTEGVSKDYLTAIIIRQSILSIILIGAATVFHFLRPDEIPSFVGILVPIVVLTIVVSGFIFLFLGFKRMQYALRERDIYYQHGFLWRSRTVIPFNRIQHAEVIQGPIERMFDLSVLRIFTAGGASSDMSIPGLRPGDANRIKEYILGKTASDEEE